MPKEVKLYAEKYRKGAAKLNAYHVAQFVLPNTILDVSAGECLEEVEYIEVGVIERGGVRYRYATLRFLIHD